MPYHALRLNYEYKLKKQDSQYKSERARAALRWSAMRTFQLFLRTKASIE